MSYGYGGQNPYDQRGQASYDDDQGNSYGQQSGVEMQSFQQAPPSDPNAIRNDCLDVENTIEEIGANNLEQIKLLQQQILQDTDTSSDSDRTRRLDGLIAETMQQYRTLTDRVRRIKGKPDANSPKNSPHVARVDRGLRTAMNEFQKIESGYRKRMVEQVERQYLIVRPDATPEEVRDAVEDTSGQIFSRALMQSHRQGQARAVLHAAEERGRKFAKIEREMVEIAQMFQDLDTMVVQQEEAVAQIEQKGEEITDNLGKGNEEIAVAIDTARSTRKKKWWCLGICVLIIVIIVIIVVIYFTVIRGDNNNNNNNGSNNNTSNSNAKRAPEPSGLDLPINVDQVSRVMRRMVAEWQPNPA